MIMAPDPDTDQWPHHFRGQLVIARLGLQPIKHGNCGICYNDRLTAFELWDLLSQLIKLLIAWLIDWMTGVFIDMGWSGWCLQTAPAASVKDREAAEKLKGEGESDADEKYILVVVQIL